MNFGEGYWRFSELLCTREQTAAEIRYLKRVLEGEAPGRRVVDLGCGPGRHAIGLAEAGFKVAGLDVSEMAIEEAQHRSSGAGLDIRWEIVDLLMEDRWPISEVDAAICVNSFGWSSCAAQRRFLRRIRDHLAPNGILILSDLNLFWFILHLEKSSGWPIGNATLRIERTFDPVSGRCTEILTVFSNDGTSSRLQYDRRLYSHSELTSLIRQAGFYVRRVEADFSADRAFSTDCRSLQVCARRLVTPPVSLAVVSWRTPDDSRLDLRYAPDEAQWLEPSPEAIWRSVLESESNGGADALGYYPVNDPYGGERAAAVATEHFACRISHRQLTLGPGVTPLLHDLCGLADGGLILGPQLVHPDLTAWAIARGNEVHLVEEPATPDRLIEEIRKERPSLVHLDRPRLFDDLISLDDLYRLGVEAGAVGAVLLVDESPATYLGPAGSAVPLIHCLNNLVILRGLTKAYSWGGLRVGFAYASEGISACVRELVSPLQVSELGFRAVLRLLEAGDIFHPLRARIRATKPGTIGLLRGLGLEVFEGHPELPWVVVPDAAGKASRLLDRLGIRGLRFVPSPALRGPYPERLLLFSPLSDQRIALLRERLVGALADSS